MVRRAWLVACLLAAGIGLAQEEATTASGRTVILMPDGTWRERESAPLKGVSASPKATAKLEISRGKNVVYYDPKKWRRSPAAAAEPGRTTFVHSKGDGYAVVIEERIEVPADALPTIALGNAQSAAADAEIVMQERRKVNGRELTALQINGTIQGIPFTYFGYYHSGKEGTVQVLTYTARNLFDEYQPEFESFLNGFAPAPQ